MRQSEAACDGDPRRALGEELLGYLAALAFVAAYVLMLSGVWRVAQASLNLAGSAIAGTYLWRKRALPNVLLNVAWAVITIVGLFAASQTE